MKVRPKSITIISWFLIITSGISIIPMVLNYNNPEIIKIAQLSVIPLMVQYVITAIGLIVIVSSAVLMLKNKNIGRILYVGWTFVSLFIGLFNSPVKTMMIPGLVLFLIITFFLFRPKANEYFSKI